MSAKRSAEPTLYSCAGHDERLAALEARIAVLELALIQARTTWDATGPAGSGVRSDAVWSMLLKGGQ